MKSALQKVRMIQKIISEIEINSTFLITAHENPDGDAVGSSLALANFLSEIGKEVIIYHCDPLPDNYAFLPMADRICSVIPEQFYDICFVLDAGDLCRAGSDLATFGKIGKIINIDHHPDNKKFGELNLVDPKASATGALIYRILTAAGHAIDYDTALCIYTAIVTDTGSFRYSNANPEAFTISAAMVAVIVRMGEKNNAKPDGITGAFPVTIITAIVSPKARPIPNMIAVKTPERAAGKVTYQMVCHSVVPRARDASR